MKKIAARLLATASFTLIELLVVITIIGVLAGIALPVFKNVQERGKATQEANDLRQIGLATAAYLNDNGNQIFPSTTGTWAGILYPTYANATKIFVSPFDSRISASTSGTSGFPVSFGINKYVLGTSGTFTGNMDRLTYSSALICFSPNVSQTTSGPFLTTDTDTSSNPTSGVVVDPSALNTTKNWGTYSNRGLINVLYADWHVQALTWGVYATYSTTSQQWIPQ